MDFEMDWGRPVELPAPVPDECEGGPCQTGCENVFARVRVRPTIRFGAWVEWLLSPWFTDRTPHVFQLQVGHTGVNEADDWQDVGLSAAGVSYAVDDTQRVRGKTQWTHYRVKLTTPDGVHYSTPEHCLGDMPLRYWRVYQARLRQWRTQMQRTMRGAQGWLLKRRLTGTAPPPGDGRIDFLTDEVVDAQHPTTIGTEWLLGYYAPTPCVWADLGEMSRRESRDPQRGQVNDPTTIRANFLGVPLLDSYDVWVDPRDLRWEVHRIDTAEEIQDVPVLFAVELRLLPFTHPTYSIEIPDQLPTGVW